MGKLYDQVRSIKTLRKAWVAIYQNGIRSTSPETRKEIVKFSEDVETHLARIANQLRKGKFKFVPAHGVAIKKKGKNSKRPIVLSPIPNRIVQRALLDVIQTLPEVITIQKSWQNFGGVPEIGVPEAVTTAYEAMLKNQHFIRTDIQAFFVNIPRAAALAKITQFTNSDGAFNELLVGATEVELDNVAELALDAQLFPLEEIGVAQGSCLSPLLCNLLLEEFDRKMNERGVVCIRYIDDFILFAPTEQKVNKAFKNAKQYLGSLGLSVYDPAIDHGKAERGISRSGFDFLGCSIKEDNVRPSKEAVRRVRDRVKELIQDSLSLASDPIRAVEMHKTYPETLQAISRVLQGWANTYVYCTDRRLIQNVDQEIDNDLSEYKKKIHHIHSRLSKQDKRRLEGVYLLQDCAPKSQVRLHQLVEDEKRIIQLRRKARLTISS